MKSLSSTEVAKRCVLKSALTASMLCAGLLNTGLVRAQVIVSDPILEGAQSTSNVTQGTQLAKQILQYEKQIQQYTTQLEQLRNMLTKIESLGTGVSLTPKTLEPLSGSDQDKLVDQACPGAASGGVVLSAISGLLGGSDQPITERQNLICREIVMIQIDEYNITAQALGSLTAQASTVQKLSEIINSISTFGESSSATSQAEQFMSQLKLAGDTWQKQIEADERMVATLRQQQGVLAKVALNGSNTILGNVVQAAALKAAFTINE
jgi:conjugal transfer/entry exclusion protein